MLDFLVCLVAFRYFPDGSASELRRQAKGIPDCPVTEFVDAYLPKRLFSKGYLGSVIARLVKGFHCLEQGDVLLWR